ncbi:UDP-2,3-diacylglucosamine diphosphatase [Thiomicrospira sp. WB1]|uniref:UDP-2,3-diacylglucosamine diphosphatase n=1 Tax=Thiomicrospira sp. WB1 TaxID=1685380 RepID=UPI00074AD282|nr:UDP-2,3-diacylglucosamine diphosphatase [Thiomicrospira sp. WB1]KUJ72956.1 UDP-2,3-diacylglucosamine hydrolase [Thiomicrospira sp. WB1]
MNDRPRTRFVADVHLLPEVEAVPEVNATFHHFLDDCLTQSVDQLYILGDLFEMWVGDDIGLQDYAQSIAKFRALTQSGIEVNLIEGNRDFLMRHDFYHATGITRLTPPYRLNLNGEQWLLLHGDELCTSDHGYQRMRRILRHPWVMGAFLRLPAQTRQRIGRKMRDQSQKFGGRKAQNITDVNDSALQALMQAYPDTQRILHGHTHRPGVYGKRWVLGDWRPQAWWVEVTPMGAQWHYWRGNH